MAESAPDPRGTNERGETRTDAPVFVVIIWRREKFPGTWWTRDLWRHVEVGVDEPSWERPEELLAILGVAIRKAEAPHPLSGMERSSPQDAV